MTRSEVEFRRGARRLVGIAMGRRLTGQAMCRGYVSPGQPVISLSGGRMPRLWRNREHYYSSPSSALRTLGMRLGCALPRGAAGLSGGAAGVGREAARRAENQKKKSLTQTKRTAAPVPFFF